MKHEVKMKKNKIMLVLFLVIFATSFVAMLPSSSAGALIALGEESGDILQGQSEGTVRIKIPDFYNGDKIRVSSRSLDTDDGHTFERLSQSGVWTSLFAIGESCKMRHEFLLPVSPGEVVTLKGHVCGRSYGASIIVSAKSTAPATTSEPTPTSTPTTVTAKLTDDFAEVKGDFPALFSDNDDSTYVRGGLDAPNRDYEAKFTMNVQETDTLKFNAKVNCLSGHCGGKTKCGFLFFAKNHETGEYDQFSGAPWDPPGIHEYVLTLEDASKYIRNGEVDFFFSFHCNMDGYVMEFKQMGVAPPYTAPTTGTAKVCVNNEDNDNLDVKLWIGDEYKSVKNVPYGSSKYHFGDYELSPGDYKFKIKWKDPDTNEWYEDETTEHISAGEKTAVTLTVEKREVVAPTPTATLTIVIPTDGTTVTTPSITVAGTAHHPFGIASVTVNGALASGAADWSTWCAEVALVVGENTVTVVAANNLGRSTTETLNVIYAPVLDGKVLSSSTNEGIHDATVTLVGTGKTAQTTGTNGYYSFSGVADGSYTLTASKLGYIFSLVDVVVSETTHASPIMGTIDTSVLNAEIISTVMPSGSFKTGESVDVTITVTNIGTIEHTFYIGYSVRDPENTFWDAPYVPVTLSPGDSDTETLSWTVQPGAPAGLYDAYTAVWATQHWSYLYDNLDRENKQNTFSVLLIPVSVHGWKSYNGVKYDVLVDGKQYTAVWTVNNSNYKSSWLIYDVYRSVPDLLTFQHAAKTATVANMLGADTADDIESLRDAQKHMNKFTGWTALGKFTLWIRDTAAYLTGKFIFSALDGGTSLTTEMPASEALQVARREIAHELKDKIIDDLKDMATPTLDEATIKSILESHAVAKVQYSALKLGVAADTIEAHDNEELWTYDEVSTYYDNYKSGVIEGMANMELTSKLQPGADFVTQMSKACNEALKGFTSGIIDVEKFDETQLLNSINDIEAVRLSAIKREKYNNTFATLEAEFGANAIELWRVYQNYK